MIIILSGGLAIALIVGRILWQNDMFQGCVYVLGALIIGLPIAVLFGWSVRYVPLDQFQSGEPPIPSLPEHLSRT